MEASAATRFQVTPQIGIWTGALILAAVTVTYYVMRRRLSSVESAALASSRLWQHEFWAHRIRMIEEGELELTVLPHGVKLGPGRMSSIAQDTIFWSTPKVPEPISRFLTDRAKQAARLANDGRSAKRQATAAFVTNAIAEVAERVPEGEVKVIWPDAAEGVGVPQPEFPSITIVKKKAVCRTQTDALGNKFRGLQCDVPE